MTNTLRVGGTTTISRVDSGMSTAVRDQLNAISPGLADRMATGNHFNPAAGTPFTTNLNDLGVGWLMIDPYSTPIEIVDDDDPAAPFGKYADVYVPDGAEVRVDSVVHGAAPLFTLLDDVSALTSNFHYTHTSPGGPFYQLKNWTGDNSASRVEATAIPAGIVDSTHLRFGSHVTHSGTTYVCIKRHTAGSVSDGGDPPTNLDADGVLTEPGVGSDWASYWTAVADLAVAPSAWALSTFYFACDGASASSNWGTDPASGTAKIRFSGGIGNHSLQTIPSVAGRTLLGDIHYFRFISKVPTGFKINDGTGGDKGVEISLHPQAFQGAPGWGGFGGDGFLPGDDDFPTVALGGSLYSVTEFDGVTHETPESISGQWYASGITRGTYAVWEAIFKLPRTRGASGEQWWYVNGEPSDVSGTTPASNGQSHHTFRIGDQFYPPVVEGAWRAYGATQATTVGGGGSMSIPGRHTQIAEWMYSVGISEAGVAADHFSITCEEGSTPSAGSPIHFIAELRDADDVRMDVYTDEWNAGSGRQKLHITSSTGTATLVATTSSSYFAGDGLGRVRIQVTGATSGVPLVVSLSLDEVYNNDTLSGNHFDGSLTVNPT